MYSSLRIRFLGVSWVLVMLLASRGVRAYNNVEFAYDPTDDATVSTNDPTRNYDGGSNTEPYWLRVGDAFQNGSRCRACLKFNINSHGDHINRCELSLYAHDKNSGSVWVDAYRASNTTWTENNINWNAQSAWSLTLLDQVQLTTSGTLWDGQSYYAWNVTDGARWAKSNANGILSLVMTSSAEGTSGLWARFHSREHPGYNGVKYRPRLYIDSAYCYIHGVTYTQISPRSRILSIAPHASVWGTCAGGGCHSSAINSGINGDYTLQLYATGGSSGKRITLNASTTGYAGSATFDMKSNNDAYGRDVVMYPVVQMDPAFGTDLEPVMNVEPGAQFATPAFAYQLPESSNVETSGFTADIVFDATILQGLAVEPIPPFEADFAYDIDNQAGVIIVSADIPGGMPLPLGPPEAPTPIFAIQWICVDMPEPAALTWVAIEPSAFRTPGGDVFSIGHRTGIGLGSIDPSLDLISPDGGETIMAGGPYEITWTTTGIVDQVLIEYADEDAMTFQTVAIVDNAGVYAWDVPMTPTERGRIRISDLATLGVSDHSAADFTVMVCPLAADITGDCAVTMNDFAALAGEWLECAGPDCP